MEVPERYAHCKRQLINLWSTNQERRKRYRLARSLGMSSYEAMKVRSWRVEYIRKRAAYYEAACELFMSEWAEEQRKGVESGDVI